MEALLGKVTQQAMNYAIRTGITITSGYAIRQCGRLLKTVEGQEKEELAALQLRLESKIRIISPAIDMIELIAARGNTSLESAVILTKSLRWDIQALGVRLAKAVGEEQLARKGSSKGKSRTHNELELKLIISDIKKLLNRIEDAVPLINLAITTSGVNLSTTLPATVSPSRLLQASTFLTAGDTQYSMSLPRSQQIGPTFTLSMYMLFSGHLKRSRDEGGVNRETTWKEVMHKARVKLLRVPLNNVYDYPAPFHGDTGRSDEENQHHIPSEGKIHEFAYQLLVVEDLDDDRVHTVEDDEEQPGPYEGVVMAGTREIIPIHEISKIFYADTGKILSIGTNGETNNPILLLKRDVNAIPPRRMMGNSAEERGYVSDDSQTVGGSDLDDEQSELDDQLYRESTASLPDEPQQEKDGHPHPWRLPPTLDLEWLALEVYSEEPKSDSEFDESEIDLQSPSSAASPSPDSDQVSPGLAAGFSKLNLSPLTPSKIEPPSNTQLIPSPSKVPAPNFRHSPRPSPLPAIKTSLSLLEMLIRLTALQQFQQSSHLAIPDELLNFFLSENSTVGSGGDSELRRRIRREARMRVGFDPYDESPIKRRGEDYLEHEFRDGDEEDVYEDISPGSRGASRPFDYDGYPHGKASTAYSSRSRSSTPVRSSPFPDPSTTTSGRSRSSTDDLPNTRQHSDRPSFASVSSASPLLRKATTQPGQLKGFKQPSFSRPPTAPYSSSSPRFPKQPATSGTQQMGRGSQAPDTPPNSDNR